MHCTQDNLPALQEILEYTFKDILLLKTALTHSSAGIENNERLEFLGDRVLGLVMADALLEHFSEEQEGDLAKRHAALVCGEMLAEIGQEINLGDHILFSHAEYAAGGPKNEKLIADAMEAIIGALFLDSDFEHCQTVITRLWGDRIKTMKTPPRDPKTQLQEWGQARGLPIPTYEIINKKGPDHAPVFEIEVRLQNYPSMHGKGTSRRDAEKAAAKALLKELGER